MLVISWKLVKDIWWSLQGLYCMPLSFSPFCPVFLCQLKNLQPSCSPRFLKQPTLPSFPPRLHLFLCKLLRDHLIYLSEWLFCIKEQQIKTEKPFEIFLGSQKNPWSKSNACLLHELRACDSALGHGTIADYSSHGTLPCPFLRMQLFQQRYLAADIRCSSFHP